MVLRLGLKPEGISIHAPVKGATEASTGSVGPDPDFNPRTREGCDLLSREFRRHSLISIHAPVKGATGSGANLHDFTFRFQSTHP